MCYTLIFTVMVICLNVHLCAGRPYADGEGNTLSDNGLETLNAENKYKLPTKLNGDLDITIKGLNINHSTFTAKLPLKSPDATGSVCELVYNFEKQQLEMNPTSSEEHEVVPYTMDLQNGKPATIKLILKPRTFHDNHIIDFNFNGNENGPSDILTCKVNSFMDIDDIVIKGLEKVISLKFEFDPLK